MNRQARLSALVKWLQWQIGSRLVPGPVMVPFVNGSVLIVEPGMTGATGAVYCGLHEYKEMAFALHLCRPGDLVFDIGANVGSYTVLAAAIGCRVVACEPIEEAFDHLQRNILVNGFDSVVAVNVGLGAASGTLHFTTDKDTMNKVVDIELFDDSVREVPVQTIDEISQEHGFPSLIKIDVEGYETPVLRGAQHTLTSTTLKALIVEIGDPESGGEGDISAGQLLEDAGFQCIDYLPETRVVRWGASTARPGNQLYARPNARIDEVLSATRTHTVAGRPV